MINKLTVIFFLLGKMLVTRFIILFLSLVGAHSEQLLMNHGVKFSDPKTINFVNNEWTHTFRFDMPDYHFNSDIGRNYSLCRDTYFYEKGCTISVEFNTLRILMEHDIQSLLHKFRSMIPTISDKRKTRESQPLLPFIGQLGSTLFGIATTSQLNRLRDHANKLAQRVNLLTNTFTHEFGEMASFATNVHEHMKLFDEFVANASAVRHKIVDEMESMSNKHTTAEKLILDVNDKMIKIRSQFDRLAIGIESLSNRKLSIHIINPELMSQTLTEIASSLKINYPTHKLVSTELAFYYNHAEFIYGRNNNSIYIMVLFPLTNSLDNEIYELNFFPIPLDNDIKNKDANEFTSKPRYLIYNGKNLLFTFLDESFLRDCLTAGSTILCKHNVIFEIDFNTNCFVELLKHGDNAKTKDICEYKIVRNVLKPELRILNSSKVLAYMQSNLKLECVNRSKTIDDCKYCIIDVPCACKLVSKSQRIDEQFTKCLTNDTTVDQIYPINLPLLQQFFNNTVLDKLMKNISYNDPINVLLPVFKTFDQNTQDILTRSHKLEIDMQTFVKRAKKNQIVYHSLTEAMLNGEISIESGLSTFDIISIIGILLTIGNTLMLIFLSRKIRILLTAITLIKPTAAQHLKYDNPTTLSPLQEFTNSLNESLKYEHFLVFLAMIHVLLLITILRKLQIFKRQRGTLLILHVSNGLNCIDINIVSSVSCRSEWIIDLPVTLNINSIRFGLFPKLLINTTEISFRNATGDIIMEIPSALSIGIYQYIKLRQMLNTNYHTELFLVHNGIKERT